MEKILFKSEEQRSSQEVASVLRSFADKIEEGKVVLRKGEEETELHIPSNLTIEIKVEEEIKGRTKKSLEIELEWIEGGEENENKQDTVVE